MNDYPNYRDDNLNKKDTGRIVQRYLRALRQLQMPVPADVPFKDYLPLVQNDNTVDPFDATEMLGVTSDSTVPAPSGPRQNPAGPLAAPATPAKTTTTGKGQR